MQRPNADEYAPFYETYVSKLAETNILVELDGQGQDFVTQLKQIAPGRESFSYAEGKWTVKQLVQHIIDAERVFAIRILRIARNDKTPNPGFDENEYAAVGDALNRTLRQLIDEFIAVRSSTLHLLSSLNEEDTAKTGMANGQPISVRALAYIIAGHQIHHHQILKERYLA